MTEDEAAGPTDHQPPAVAPGWYPDGQGAQRYWDGAVWTDHTAPVASSGMDSTGIAALVHVGGIFFGFLSPLVAYLALPDDEFVRWHARHALNFQITLMIAYLIAAALVLVLIGIVLIFILLLGSLVLQVMAAIAASRGERYTYPMTYEFLSG